MVLMGTMVGLTRFIAMGREDAARRRYLLGGACPGGPCSVFCSAYAVSRHPGLDLLDLLRNAR